VIDEIIKHLFGDAVLARVRKDPRFIRILWEAFFYASAVGILGGFLFGLSVFSCFFAIIGLFAEAVVQVYFSDVHKLYCQWIDLRRRTYLCLFIFGFLRLIVGETLGIYPTDTYKELENAGGLVNSFGRGHVPKVVLCEVLYTIIVGSLCYRAVFTHSRAARRALWVVATIATVILGTQIAAPETRPTRETVITNLEEHGVVVTAVKGGWRFLFGTPEPDSGSPTNAPAHSTD
jgi:hypothetical protein